MVAEPSSETVPRAKCYLCGEQRPKADTEVTRHTVPYSPMGVFGSAARYVRMCRIGFGCKAQPLSSVDALLDAEQEVELRADLRRIHQTAHPEWVAPSGSNGRSGG